jgi:hypothetical protein
MTREEVKKLMPILVAFADGKTIESRCIKGDKPLWYDDEDPSFDNDLEYRIKQEPKYRPFKNTEECWQEMQKHQPFGWLKDKNDGHRTLITVVDNEDMMALNGITGWDFLSIMNMYVFSDGKPFGAKIE